jgi:hypothetical protein
MRFKRRIAAYFASCKVGWTTRRLSLLKSPKRQVSPSAYDCTLDEPRYCAKPIHVLPNGVRCGSLSSDGPCEELCLFSGPLRDSRAGRHCKPKSSFFVISSIFCAVDRQSGSPLARPIAWYFAGSIACLPQCWMR